MSISQKLDVITTQNVRYVLPVAVARSSAGGVVMFYTSAFVDDHDVMFAHEHRRRKQGECSE